jgi:hypothetical protein
MAAATLQDFINLTTSTNRITFGDVKRLRRSVLPDGLIEREEVEALLALDASVKRSDPAWTEWLVASVVDYAVWGERPTGYVESEGATWLLGLLTRHGMATKAARLIAREVAREAQAVDEAIEDMAAKAGEDGEDDSAISPAETAAAPVAEAIQAAA